MVTRSQVVLGVLVVAAAGAGAWAWLTPPPAVTAAAPPRPAARGSRASAPIPRIDLARLDAPRPDLPVGQRNLFDYGPEPTPVPTPTPEPTPTPTPPPPTVPTPTPAPTPVPLAPMRLKLIGQVQNKQGLKVAVFLVDDKLIQHAREGETVANRFKVVKIGLESADVQEIGTDRVQRLPLRGN